MVQAVLELILPKSSSSDNQSSFFRKCQAAFCELDLVFQDIKVCLASFSTVIPLVPIYLSRRVRSLDSQTALGVLRVVSSGLLVGPVAGGAVLSRLY